MVEIDKIQRRFGRDWRRERWIRD